MSPIFDPGLFVVWCAVWLALAVLALRAGARLAPQVFARVPIYDWTLRRAARRLESRGWSGRHGLPDRLVSAVESGTVEVAELEEISPRPTTENTAIRTEDEQRQVDEMREAVETVREDFTFTEASRTARRVALQADTVLIPIVKLLEVDAADRTRAEFSALDGLAAEHDLEFATQLGVFLHDNTLLLAELEVARMYRGWLSSTTGENPIVAEAVAAC